MSGPEPFRPVQFTRPDGTLHAIALGDTPDILLLHAGEEHAGVFKPAMRLLLGSGYGTLALDQRGHGKSRQLAKIPLSLFADDAAILIQAMSPPVVVGASLGGFVLMLALAASEVRKQVKALVLLDVIPDPDPEPVREFLSTALANGISNPLVEHILDLAPELRASCQQLDIPVLLVRAGHGTTMTDEAEHRFRILVPHAEVVTIDNAAHLVAQTAPIELAGILTTFAARFTP